MSNPNYPINTASQPSPPGESDEFPNESFNSQKPQSLTNPPSKHAPLNTFDIQALNCINICHNTLRYCSAMAGSAASNSKEDKDMRRQKPDADEICEIRRRIDQVLHLTREVLKDLPGINIIREEADSWTGAINNMDHLADKALVCLPNFRLNLPIDNPSLAEEYVGAKRGWKAGIFLAESVAEQVEPPAVVETTNATKSTTADVTDAASATVKTNYAEFVPGQLFEPVNCEADSSQTYLQQTLELQQILGVSQYYPDVHYSPQNDIFSTRFILPSGNVTDRRTVLNFFKQFLQTFAASNDISNSALKAAINSLNGASDFPYLVSWKASKGVQIGQLKEREKREPGNITSNPSESINFKLYGRYMWSASQWSDYMKRRKRAEVADEEEISMNPTGSLVVINFQF